MQTSNLCSGQLQPCVLGFSAVGTKGAGGGAIALPDFGKYVNPI